MSGEVRQFIRAEVLRALEFRFELLVFKARVRRGMLAFGEACRRVQVSSRYEPEEQEHQRWPAGAFERLQMLAVSDKQGGRKRGLRRSLSGALRHPHENEGEEN